MRLPNKYFGQIFSFFNSKKTFDSNLFSVLVKESAHDGKRSGIGFGGANRDTCKLWLDYELISRSFVAFNNIDAYDGCLLYSIDQLMKRLCLQTNQQRPNHSRPNSTSDDGSQGEEGSIANNLLSSYSFKNVPKISSNRLDIEVLSVEVWSVMNAETFEAFNNRLDEQLDSNHYDKMVERNCSRGTKDAETLMENINDLSFSG
jgi:hypothetical protein